MADKLSPVEAVGGFFDIVENGPAGAARFVVDLIVPGASLLMNSSVIEAAGAAIKPKRHDDDDSSESSDE